MLAALTPKPFRGDVIAAGAVVLMTLVWSLLARFSGTWPAGTHLAYTASAFAFVCAIALLAPMESDKPRAYQSVLYLVSLSLWAGVLLSLVAVLGVDRPADVLHAVAVCLVLIAWLAFGFAVRNNSAACTLVAAIALGLAVLALYWWFAEPDGLAAFRWVLLFETALFALAAIGNRDRRPRHGVALINAAGLAVLLIGLSFATWWEGDPRWFLRLGDGPDMGQGSAYAYTYSYAVSGSHVAWGWELLILAAGFGLIAYSSVDRQPGPAYVGLLNLILFTGLSSAGVIHPTFLGWPVVLAIAAAFLLIVGLRPTTPAPPPPDIDAPEAPPLPLR